MLFNFFATDWATNRDLLRVKRAHIETIDAQGEHEFVLMHGWHSLYSPLLGLENAVRERFPNSRIWRVTYDSHWKTFGYSAREINGLLSKKGVKAENTILMGYSMGGVVARSMVAHGFNARAVVCIASPHLGPAPWMPIGDVGSTSIAPWSRKLARLNSHPVDKKRRGDYYFHAFNFTDSTGFCRHDRIVSWRSAIGTGIEGVGKRHTVHLNYEGVAPHCHPHLQGMNPNCLGDAFDWVENKLAETAPQKRLIVAGQTVPTENV